MTARLGDLDDPDYPAYTTGRAAEVLGVQQAFLRALDTAGAVTPQRTAGGRRRYSRRQLVFAARIRELFDQGHTLGAAPPDLAPENGPRHGPGPDPPPARTASRPGPTGRALTGVTAGLCPAAGARAASGLLVARCRGGALPGTFAQPGQLGLP